MLAPSWHQFKVGPLLRRESDWRLYLNLFRASPNEVTGLRKRIALMALPRTAEPTAVTKFHVPDNSLVIFEGMQQYFTPLIGANEVLRDQLHSIVTQDKLAACEVHNLAPIGIHVRRGDFKPIRSSADLLTMGGVRTPVEWFIETLRLIRKLCGAQVPAFVVSDGSHVDLRDLLREPSVQLRRFGSSIADMLGLSMSKFILASGGSSFSAWASFLNQVPVVSIVGQPLTWFGLRHANGEYVGVLDPGRPTEEFRNAVGKMSSCLSEGVLRRFDM
jgi:hypothetical protein